MALESLPREWEAIVVGAGVAGSVAAYRLARRGLRTLLVEKSRWPRAKACGGCLNAATLQALREAGLSGVAREGRVYSRIRLASGRRQAVVGLPAGRAISRRLLDARLVESAVSAGACFLPATQALLETPPALNGRNARRLILRQGGVEIAVSTKLVLGCDGLGSRLLRDEAPGELEVDAASRIGVGCTVVDAADAYSPGTIHMACGAHGYVGLVRVEEGRLNLGAALDPVWTKRLGGPLPAVATILGEAGFAPIEALRDADWNGTPRLTRRRASLGAERVLILGDAAGYVEPFTGEGMSWALASAAAVESLALEGVSAWRPELIRRWTLRHAELVGSRQRGCRAMAALLRRPRLLAALLPWVDVAPGAVAPYTAWLNRGYRGDALKE